jgi:hypothetical protein
MNAEVAMCSDAAGKAYAVSSGGLGAIGYSFKVTTLIIRYDSNLSPAGTYVGGNLGGAYGILGGRAGFLPRVNNLVERKPEKGHVMLIGYAGGYEFDVKALTLSIWDIAETKLDSTALRSKIGQQISTASATISAASATIVQDIAASGTVHSDEVTSGTVFAADVASGTVTSGTITSGTVTSGTAH